MTLARDQENRGKDMSKGTTGGNLRSFYILFAVVAAIGIGAVAFTVGSKALGSAAMEPVERIRHCAKLSAAGNIIDFGVTSDFDLEGTLKETMAGDLAIDCSEELYKAIAEGETFLLVSDNAVLDGANTVLTSLFGAHQIAEVENKRAGEVLCAGVGDGVLEHRNRKR